MDPKRILLTGHGGLTPQLIEDPIGRNDLIGVHQHQGQERLLFEAPEVHGNAVSLKFERTEDSEFQTAAGHARLPSLLTRLFHV